MTDIWVELVFGHHMNEIEVDYGADETNEWEFIDPGLDTLVYKIDSTAVSLTMLVKDQRLQNYS